ncbi:MAG: diadenosine tetraphosphatase, partial [Holophagales bacterium]|nr:diadenosine tetraphosphatase [Holophagales bacterium]
KGPPEEAPEGCLPWWAVAGAPWRREIDTVLCGHWAALGLYREQGLWSLDSGVAWDGPLTALRLDDGTVVQQGGSRRA